MRRFDVEDTAIDRSDRSRKDQPFKERRRLVHPAITIMVLEHHDASDRLGLVGTLDVVHVTAHLDHPKSACRIECHGDRVLDHRLRGDELDPEARLQLERGELLLGCPRVGEVTLEGIRERRLDFTWSITVLREDRRKHHHPGQNDATEHGPGRSWGCGKG